jgi:small ligand-binding sensory domain FIST
VSAASGGGRFSAATALVHADADTPDLADLLTELAERTTSGQVFGGLSSGRGPAVQLAHSSRGTVAGQGASAGVFQGGLSGVALGPEVGWVSRVTQGCVAVSPRRTVTAAEGHLVLELDGRAALDVLLDDLGVDLDRPQPAIEKVRQTLVGLAEPAGPGRRDGGFGAETRVRHIVGLDPVRQAVAVADRVVCGQTLTFCERSAAAAQADLMRLCAEIREEQEALACAALADERWPPQPLAAPLLGALYISCAGRGGPHFGAPHAELQVVRRALGDVPLVGFFAGGEIAGRQLYAYTGVLTVFLAPGVAGR